MAEPTREQLADAQKKLGSPLKAEREEAEAILIAGKLASVPFLVGALADETVRIGGRSPVPRAALLAGALQAREALPAIYALVESDKLGVDDKPFVARALAELLDGQDAFDDRARAALEKLSVDRDHYTRAFAAQAYGALGDLRSKGRVQALARDADPWVREKAAAVLARLAETEALAQQSDVGPKDFAALVAAAEAEGGALKPWLDDLGDTRRAVRDAAVAELVRAGKPAVRFLLDKLNQPQTRTRIGAALALGRLQATDAAGPLLVAATAPASTSDEHELRAVALRALASCLTGMEEGLAASILPLARDKDRFVRAAALLCLGRLADRAGLAAIVTAVIEDDPFVVESAAVALSEGVRETDVEIIKPLLLALTRRTRPAVTEAILIALSRVPVEAPPLRVRVRHRVRREVHGQTASTRKASIVLLERLYADDDPPPLPLVDDVFVRLGDDHPEVRVVSASFLRTHLPAGFTGAVPRLTAALDRDERTVSFLVLEALRRHDTPEAKVALEVVRARNGTAGTNGADLGARAADLLAGFEPRASTWIFVPKTVSATTAPPAPKPPTTPPTTPPPSDAEPRANVVEARFDEDRSG